MNTLTTKSRETPPQPSKSAIRHRCSVRVRPRGDQPRAVSRALAGVLLAPRRLHPCLHERVRGPGARGPAVRGIGLRVARAVGGQPLRASCLGARDPRGVRYHRAVSDHRGPVDGHWPCLWDARRESGGLPQLRASYFIDPQGVIRALTWYPPQLGVRSTRCYAWWPHCNARLLGT